MEDLKISEFWDWEQELESSDSDNQIDLKDTEPQVQVQVQPEPEPEPETETRVHFKAVKKFNIIDRDEHLHWISQIDDEKFSNILNSITNIPSFDVKQLWEQEKSRQSNVTKNNAQQRKGHKGHKGQKNKKHVKKIDKFRTVNSAKIANTKLDDDTKMIKRTQFKVDTPFDNYKKSIVNMRLPETQLAMKIKVFEHLLCIHTEGQKTKIPLDNLVDMYFEMLRIEQPDAELRKLIRKCRLFLENRKVDLVKFQMHSLSNRLPPLNNFSTNPIRLDGWQMELLKVIDANKSAIVCAPTSAGKTVISTYAATAKKGSRVVFVAPSEPLAVQVGGLYREILGGNVEIVTNNYKMNSNSPFVVVGTPRALENCLADGHFQPTYAIFDEIHELNGDEGAAFERLIKMLDCNCLCLSATIKNIEQLQSWITKLNGLDEDVKVIIQNRRFVNLQRYLWTNSLVHLHPYTTLNMSDFQNDDILDRQFAFTPADCDMLWNLVHKHFKGKDVDQVSPERVFEQGQRLSLHDCYLYEKKLTAFMAKRAKCGDLGVKEVINDLSKEVGHEETSVSQDMNLFNLAMHLKDSKMTPAIFFQMNSGNCEHMYHRLIEIAENLQNKYIPYFTEMLEMKQEHYTMNKDQISRFDNDKNTDPIEIENRKKDLTEKNLGISILVIEQFLDRVKRKTLNSKEIDNQTKQRIIAYIDKDIKENKARIVLSHVDVYKPHPDFCYSQDYLSDQSVAEVKWDIQKELKLRLKWNGWFLRGIARGLGLYMQNLPAVYQRSVQALTQSKKLALVISDQSLAFGVNLPIRTVCLIGYGQSHRFEPLVAQQMTGRAGRRGLDREGNVVFVNVNHEEIMKGELCRIIGHQTKNQAIATYHQSTVFANDRRMHRLLTTNFRDLTNGEEFKEDVLINRLNQSQKFIDDHKLSELMTVFWALRDYGDEGQHFVKILSKINRHMMMSRIKQSKKADLLFQIIVNIFECSRKLEVEQFDQCTETQSILAYNEFRLPENHEEAHNVKNQIIYIGNLIRIVYNHLSVLKHYHYTTVLLKIIFQKLRKIIEKYSFN